MAEDSPLRIPSSNELRAELEAMVLRDLLGPVGGEEEIVTERYVRTRYILGMLAPKGQSALPADDLDEDEAEDAPPDEDEEDDLAEAGADSEDGKADSPVPKATTLLPSSFGMTFTVVRDAKEIQITAHWGHYDLIKLEDEGSAKPRRAWQRTPVGGVSAPIPLREGKIEAWSPSTEFPEVFVDGLIRANADHWTVTVYLINGQAEPRKNQDTAWLFQPELSVQAPDAAPIFEQRLRLRAPARRDAEEQATQMLYRRQVEFAVGHGVAVHADLAQGMFDRAWRIHTQSVPEYEVPQVAPPTIEEIPALADAILDMRVLAETNNADFAAALGPIADLYENWIAEQQARILSPAPDLEPYVVSARSALDNCRENLRRIRAGITLLGANPQAADAFRFANRAMWQQRIHTLFARQVRLGNPAELAAFDLPENRTWRPFQLAFILLNLPALTDPLDPERSDPTQAIADVLWFSTGGGKTEAYLGLTAYTLGLRRLQDDLGGYPSKAGVAVLMRYTLRVLTLQQFQRAAALICACEDIRKSAPEKWGDEVFRLGLWVGMRTTPNTTEQSAEAIAGDRGTSFRASNIGGRGTPRQLTNCPWCGSEINKGQDLFAQVYGKGVGRTFMFCSNPECQFSRKQSPEEGIPALTVDEEIYRRLPALLIATVDKFAQLPWKGETQMLFGRVNAYCPRHGYRSPEIEDADSHNRLGDLPAVKSKTCGPLRPPDLIIQDELHLISGPLGTLVGLYETVIDQLAEWQLNGYTIRPKVIASSATIRNAPIQVASLYLRRANIFPPSGLDAADNFFARQREPSPASPGRCYVGIIAPGTRYRALLIRVYVAALSAAQSLYGKYGKAIDPWMTLIGYFNSMRELGGMRRAVDDSVRTRLYRMDQRGLVKRSLSPSGVEELTSRKSATDIPEILDRLETQFDPVLERERDEKRKRKEKVPSSRYPIDVLLATNMISVGVDVPRLGMMVVASQPKATAEYIQATSRIGRAQPGVVFVVYNWARPRDLSHYERFEHYHATFFQHVEALSVTPFSANALSRGLTALLVAGVRLFGGEFNANEGAGATALTRDHPFVRRAIQAISRRAGLVESDPAVETNTRRLLEDRLDTWLSLKLNTAGGRKLVYTKPDGTSVALLKRPSRGDWDDLTLLNSLREVEPAINLILNDGGMDREPLEPARSEETPA